MIFFETYELNSSMMAGMKRQLPPLLADAPLKRLGAT